MLPSFTNLLSRCLTLCQVGSIDLTVLATHANAGLAATTADEVDYVYIITNNGLLTLYNITVHAEAPMVIACIDIDGQEVAGVGGGSVEGLAEYAGDGLVPATSISCTAPSSVSQDEVRVARAARAGTFCNVHAKSAQESRKL